jgi:hypothetical protein
VLADRDDRIESPQAAGHLLGGAARSAQPLRELGCCEHVRQVVGKQLSQVRGAGKPERIHHLDQPPFDDRPALPAPGSVG